MIEYKKMLQTQSDAPWNAQTHASQGRPPRWAVKPFISIILGKEDVGYGSVAGGEKSPSMSKKNKIAPAPAQLPVNQCPSELSSATLPV